MTLIAPMTEELSRPAFDLATAVFAAESTLHTAIGEPIHALRNRLDSSFAAMAGEGLSYVAIDAGDVVGCMLATDLFSQLTSDPPTDPIGALTHELRRKGGVRSLPPRHTTLIDIGAVAQDRRGEGIYRQLRQAVQTAAKAQGFRQVVGELSSAATQRHVLGRLGHRAIAEVRFEDFVHNGARPFSRITSPESLVLAVGDL